MGNVGRRKSTITSENVATVSSLIQQNPRKSVRKVAAEAGLKATSTHKILRNVLHMFPFKIQCHHAIPARTVEQRENFAQNMLNMIDQEGFDPGCIWFTDESHFYVNGFVNKQNWRFWGSENPHLCEAKALYSPKVTVWAAISSKGIIGPFFFRETVTSQRYIEILEQFVATQQALEDQPESAWFMQDGARPHRTAQVFEFLQEYFDNRVIALDYPSFSGKGMDWPPYSPDLNLCDYFLWGALKDTVFQKSPTTVQELEQLICESCATISIDTLQKVTQNFVFRLRQLCTAKGGHFEKILM